MASISAYWIRSSYSIALAFARSRKTFEASMATTCAPSCAILREKSPLPLAMSNARSPSRSPKRRSTLGVTSFLCVLSTSSLRKSSHQGAISFQICTESQYNASISCSSVMRKSYFHFVMRTTLSDRPANHSTTRFNANTSTTCFCLMVYKPQQIATMLPWSTIAQMLSNTRAFHSTKY